MSRPDISQEEGKKGAGGVQESPTPPHTDNVPVGKERKKTTLRMTLLPVSYKRAQVKF